MNEDMDKRAGAETPPADADADLRALVQEAYNGMHAPDEVRAQTLAFIERQRAALGEGVDDDAAPALSASSALASDSLPNTSSAFAAAPRCDTVPQPAAAPQFDAAPQPAAAQQSAVVSQPAVASQSAVSAQPAMRRRPYRAIRRVLAAAACVMALAVGALGVNLYVQPVAYVGVDVNPSVEFAVNAFGTVVAVDPLNDDGSAVLEGANLTNKAYADALGDLLSSDAMASYLQDGSYIEFSVTSEDDALASALDRDSTACLNAAGCAGGCNRVDEETREAAHHAGMGAGKYATAQELLELDPALTLDDCSRMTMRELRDRIDACHEETGASETGAEDAGNSAGAGANANAGENGRAHAYGEGSHDGEGGAHHRQGRSGDGN